MSNPRRHFRPIPVWKQERDAQKMILIDEPVKKPKAPAVVPASERNSKIFMAIRRVDKKINDFKPVVVCSVALDPERSRIMVVPEKWIETPTYQNLYMDLCAVAQKYCLRMRGDARLAATFKCDHPQWMRRELKVQIRAKEAREWHAFCGKCGKDLGRFEPTPAVQPPPPPGPMPKPKQSSKIIIRKKAV